MITNFDKLCGDLEKQELEAPNGIASPSTYAQLLAIYLYQNDLIGLEYLADNYIYLQVDSTILSLKDYNTKSDKWLSQVPHRTIYRICRCELNSMENMVKCNAKFLWKRIPQNITSSNPEITAIWTVGQMLWRKDLPDTYQALAAYNWTEPVANIIRALEEKIRERTLNLIGRSYSSISLDTVVSMTGLSSDAAIQACKDRKWIITTDGLTINPVPPAQPAPLHTSSEDQLFKLTEFVSFLEN